MYQEVTTDAGVNRPSVRLGSGEGNLLAMHLESDLDRLIFKQQRHFQGSRIGQGMEAALAPGDHRWHPRDGNRLLLNQARTRAENSEKEKGFTR